MDIKSQHQSEQFLSFGGVYGGTVDPAVVLSEQGRGSDMGPSDEPIRVLSLDDDKGMALLLQHHLGREGIVVDGVSECREGLERCKNGAYDLILLDYHMPSMSGLEVATAMKAQGVDIPIIMVTGSGSETVAVQCFKAGIRDYIIKDPDGQFLHRLPGIIENHVALEQQLQSGRNAIEALRLSESRFRTMLDYTFDWEELIDASGRYLYLSPSCERISGYQPREFIDDPALITTITHADDRKMVSDHRHQLLSDPSDPSEQGPTQLEYRIIHRNGDVRHLLHTCLPVFDRMGHYTGRRTSNRDVTEQRVAERALQQQMEQELIRSERMATLGEAVAGFTHDLSSPLSVTRDAAFLMQESVAKIRGLLEQDEVEEEVLLKALTRIDEAAQLTSNNLQRAITMVGSFKRISIDQASDKPRRYGLKTVLEDTVASLYHTFKRSHIKIAIECDPQLELNGVPGQMIQVVTNLLNNSWQHGFGRGLSSGNINICVNHHQHSVVIDYEDNGRGISRDVLSHIFERFFTTAVEEGGSGVGLDICYTLITQEMGGSISCQSRPGEGVHFQIIIPPSGVARRHGA